MNVGVIAKLKDGSIANGGLLIGADGNNSGICRGLKMENPKLTSIPINLIEALRHFTLEQAVPVRALNPLLFFAMHPQTKTFFFSAYRYVVKTLMQLQIRLIDN